MRRRQFRVARCQGNRCLPLWLLPQVGRRTPAGSPLRESVEFQGAEDIAVYPSSDWAERAFCRTCGTHLASQIYIDKKPHYYSFANQTPMLTEQQVIDQFTAQGGEPAA